MVRTRSHEAVSVSQAAGKSLGVQVDEFDVRDPRDFEKTFENISRTGVQAVMLGTDILFLSNAKELGGLALKYRLPLIAGSHDAGVLVAYNVDFEESYRRAAIYVDKILRGANPGDLPIEQPGQFTLIVDLRTAKALGLTVPQDLVLRANEVIR
jgi:putative ABC transport system substrate-binding protein